LLSHTSHAHRREGSVLLERLLRVGEHSDGASARSIIVVLYERTVTAIHCHRVLISGDPLAPYFSFVGIGFYACLNALGPLFNRIVASRMALLESSMISTQDTMRRQACICGDCEECECVGALLQYPVCCDMAGFTSIKVSESRDISNAA
jgi:hypothetical protein